MDTNMENYIESAPEPAAEALPQAPAEPSVPIEPPAAPE